MMRILGLFALGAALTGCATTVVKKNPGEHDHGVRYYRPKPYLIIEPGEEPTAVTLKGATTATVANATTDRFVKVTMKYMPDFSEEYSIRARAGIGKNSTKITLDDGWNLKQLDQEIDSKVSENINALANLLTSVKGFVKTETPLAAGTPPPKFSVRASNVPIGFYEAVLSPGPDGRKRLYGWRYIGFAPYEPCPLMACGGTSAKCDSAAVYALAFENGVMTFKPLGEVQNGSSEIAAQRTTLDSGVLAGVAVEAAKQANSAVGTNTTAFIAPAGSGVQVLLMVAEAGRPHIALDKPETKKAREVVRAKVQQALLSHGYTPVTVQFADE